MAARAAIAALTVAIFAGPTPAAPAAPSAQPAPAAASAPAAPSPPAAPSAPQRPAAQSAAKKDLAAAAKSTRHRPAPAPGARPARLINLHNFWTKEWLAVDPAAGPPPAATVDHFLRDHFTNKAMVMEPRLIGFLLAAAASFHSDIVEIVSGFRHPKYNLILRKKGHQVARDSQHTHGNAIDFFVPHVTAQALQTWARAQRAGGVGLYPESGFVHMDTGPIRSWSGE